MRYRLLMIAALSPLTVGGCATYIAKYAEGQCTKAGYPAGTSEYADCVNAETARQYQGIAAAGQQMQRNAQVQQQQNQQWYDTHSKAISEGFNIPPPAPAPQVPVSIMPYGVFQRSYTEGTSKICVYDKMGSPNVITIGALELCPL